MKKLILIAFVSLSLFTTSCDNDDDRDSYAIDSAELPALALETISINFPEATIIESLKRYKLSDNGTLYETRLSNNFELDFDTNGNWTEVDGYTQEVPASFIPENMSLYVTTNYPNSTITQIERETNSYDVELSNNTSLIFDLQGNFIRIDD